MDPLPAVNEAETAETEAIEESNHESKDEPIGKAEPAYKGLHKRVVIPKHLKSSPFALEKGKKARHDSEVLIVSKDVQP